MMGLTAIERAALSRLATDRDEYFIDEAESQILDRLVAQGRATRSVKDYGVEIITELGRLALEVCG